MNRTDLIAVAVRLVAENTNLIRKPSTFEALITDFTGEETYDRKIARNLEVETARAVTAIKRFKTNRAFKKIVAHV